MSSQNRSRLPGRSGMVTASRLSRVLAELGPLRDVAQAVEIHVRPAHDRGIAPAGRTLALRVALQAGHPERAGRLRDRARVLEDVLDRGTDLVVW